MTYGTDTIYLDHAATTPVDATVVQAMLPWLTERFGNPSSMYRVGQDAKAAIETARLQVARVLGCRTGEVLFTSGATESINTVLRGVIEARAMAFPSLVGTHLITTRIEHHAALHEIDRLIAAGLEVTFIEAGANGVVLADEVRAAIRAETALISVMYANNEHGAVQPVAEIGAIARESGIPFHIDAVQAAGSLPLDVRAVPCEFLSLSAHKFYGPKGVGVLYCRKGAAIDFQQLGGGQESGRRGGTENVASIVGLGEAIERAEVLRDAYNEHCHELRDTLWHRMQESIPDIELNGPLLDGPRLANNLNVTIPGIQGETVLLSLDMAGVSASAGSACTTGNSEPSHVLLASGRSEADARSSLRFTVGRGNSLDEIEQAAAILAETVLRVRALA